MKKIILLISMLFIGLLTFISCGDEDPIEKVNDLKLKTSEVAVLLNKSVTVEIIDGNGGYKLSTSNNSVTVSLKKNTITIKGMDVGTSNVNVIDSKNKKSVIKVTITAEDLSVDSKTISIKKGLKRILNISKGSGKYTVSSSDKTIAKVSLNKDKIEVEGLKKGKVTITVTDIKTSKKISISVNVTLEIEDVTVGKKEVSVNNSDKIIVSITKGSGQYTVSSSDEKIAKAVVNSDKVEVAGIKKGKVTITITDQVTSKTTSFVVNVTVQSLVINETLIELTETNSKTINITSGSGDYLVSPSNSSIATAKLSKDIITITGVKINDDSKFTFQETLITLKDKQSGETKEITVKVSKTLVIDKKELSVFVNENNAILLLSGNTANIKISSKDNNIATGELVAYTSGAKGIKVNGFSQGETEITITDGVTSHVVKVFVTEVPKFKVSNSFGNEIVVKNLVLAVGGEDLVYVVSGSGDYRLSGNQDDRLKPTKNESGEVFIDKGDGTKVLTLSPIAKIGDYTFRIRDNILNENVEITVRVIPKDKKLTISNPTTPDGVTYVEDSKLELTGAVNYQGYKEIIDIEGTITMKVGTTTKLVCSNANADYFARFYDVNDSKELKKIDEFATVLAKDKTSPDVIIEAKEVGTSILRVSNWDRNKDNKTSVFYNVIVIK